MTPTPTRDRLAAQGAILFRWRSFLPLLLLVPVVAALPQSGLFEAWFGETAETIWDLFSLAVASSGLAIRVATAGHAPSGTSGRNTHAQRADSLNTTGLYSVVRNPLYLGNLLILAGFLLAVKVWWVALLGMVLALVYYERIVLAEEAYLSRLFGLAYETWASRLPAFWPRFGSWRPAALPFCWRTALRREQNGAFLIVVVLTVIEAMTDVVGEGQGLAAWAREDSAWLWFLIIGTILFLILRLIRKRTDWLRVAGR
ncbi:MAG: isoprenylcysteine carboxylmethyltransferase family protein [Alphaproteobacteria bacterium]